jgi:hypothetical protein
MKTKILLLGFALLSSVTAIAQDLWPNENAEWWSQITYFLFSPAWQHSYVNGDTLIAGKLCTKHTTDQIWAWPNTPDDIQVQASQTNYLYFNGGTLFGDMKKLFSL